MKTILGIAAVLGLVGALTVVAQEVKPGQVDVVDLGRGVKLEMVLVPAGKFMMGFTKKELADFKVDLQEGLKKELEKELGKEDLDFVDILISLQGMQHEVTLTKPYYMGKYEVTQAQWVAVMNKNPSTTKGANLPVTNVSWEDCQEFINKLNAETKGGYRLPTEAEWEYACRAGTTTAYSFGDKITPKNANYYDSETGKPVAVGSYKPNAFGLYDMHGNVCEYCEDWHRDFPFTATTPKGPSTEKYRALRGGTFNDNALLPRSSYRIPNSTIENYHLSGFRLARTSDDKASLNSIKEIIPDPTGFTPGTRGLLVAPFTEAKAKESQKVLAKILQKEVEDNADISNNLKLEMVLIPAGKFMMGSKMNPVDPFSNVKVDQPGMAELPQHEVTLTKPFYMGKYEVTQEQWFEIMEKNPSEYKGRKLPVTNVSWIDCQEFIKKLNEKTKGGYRLPTEAEWEYACRAGTTTAYSFGDKITPKDANYYDSKLGKPVAVGSYKPNAFGLYDMHGNVWEWCEDLYGAYSAAAVIDPKGPAKGEGRVLRGWSYYFSASDARSSLRGDVAPTYRGDFNGFRLARTP